MRMELAHIEVSGVEARVREQKPVPEGIRGAVIRVSFADHRWENLQKTVVFRGAVTRDVVDPGDVVTVPAECVETAGLHLRVGFYGTDAHGEIAIPTLWADLGRVRAAADPSGDESTDPQLPVWAQILERIGDLEDLDTDAREDLVCAINEALTKGGAALDEEALEGYVTGYLTAHPPAPGRDGLTPSIGANGNWFLGDQDTGLPSRGLPGAQGPAGPQGIPGAAGSNGIDGKDGRDGENGRDGMDGRTPVRGIDYWTEADRKEMEDFLAEELANRGQLAPEFASSAEECTDTSKMYVLPDGYIYAYLYGESEAVTYTNILEGTQLHLNQRINSSGSYVELNGYVSTDYLKAKPGDVVRVNRNITNASYDKNRVYAYNSAKTVAYGKDGIATYYSPVTDEGNGVYSFIFGQVYKTYGNSSSGTQMITTISGEGYMRLNIGLSGSAISAADVDDLVITLNEPISAGKVEGYDWRNTGVPFIPADYEDRIAALEKKVASGSGSCDCAAQVFAPSPQLPADGSGTADFNALNMTAQDIYNYLDALCEQYPNYITKETLGKDAGGTLDVNRYVLCRHYYKAWQKENCPKMYGWVNGSEILYSESVSPRIGDTLYTTPYIGTAKGTVTAVSNADQSRTVGGVVYTRDKTKDVEPALVFTSILGNTVGGTVYNASQAGISKIAALAGDTMTASDGTVYTRYPMGDRGRTMERSTAVVLGANEHGFTPDPREPAIVCARLAKDLCQCRNADNLFLNRLKNEIMLVIVPVINPYGFNRSDGAGYYNANGVNINRNYDCPGWSTKANAGPHGAYGGSEIETQYFMNTISEPGAAVAVSVHALGHTPEGGSTLCHYQGNNFNFEKTAVIAEIMAANYNLQFTDYGRTPPDDEMQAGKSPAYITWAGARGGIIELQAEGASAQRNTAYILEADYTLLLQCVNMWLSDSEETLI